MIKLSSSSKWFGVAIVLVQLFDAVIHIATDQLEPTRADREGEVAADLVFIAVLTRPDGAQVRIDQRAA